MVWTEPLFVELKMFSSLSCRHTTLSLRVRLSWRPNRLFLRTQPRHTLNIWSSSRPISKPPRSTSSPRPPMAAAPVKFTSQNLKLYSDELSKPSTDPWTDPACRPQQLVRTLMNKHSHMHMDTDLCTYRAKMAINWWPAQFYVSVKCYDVEWTEKIK